MDANLIQLIVWPKENTEIKFKIRLLNEDFKKSGFSQKNIMQRQALKIIHKTTELN